MSPVDPLSPTSPMDLSPISSDARRLAFEIPSTPVISPSLHLPRLVTSFQSTPSNASPLRKMSLQYQLPPFSPRALQQAPFTATHRRQQSSLSTATPPHKRSDAINSERSTLRDARDAVPSSTTTPGFLLPSLRCPQGSDLPSISPSARWRLPSLRRKYANDGLVEIQTQKLDSEEEWGSEASSIESPIIDQICCLPLQLNTQVFEASDSTAGVTDSTDVDKPDSDFELANTAMSPRTCHCRPILPRPSPTKPSTRSPTDSRSPIRKYKRQNAKVPKSPRLIVSRPLTVQQRQIRASVTHLASTLVPLISVTTGLPHPEFPKSLLQYHLLTHDQLDSLARWYHQTVDAGKERWLYPGSLAQGRVWCGSTPAMQDRLARKGVGLGRGTPGIGRRQMVDLDTKRRRWGRFIGLRGCESPIDQPGYGEGQQEANESIFEMMEREWREGLGRQMEEEKLKEKIWRGRF